MKLQSPQSGIPLPPGVVGDHHGDVIFEIHCFMWKKEEFFDKHCEVQIHWWGDKKSKGSFFSPVICNDQDQRAVETHLPQARDVVLYKSVFPVLTNQQNLYGYFNDLSSMRLIVRVINVEEEEPHFCGETYLTTTNLTIDNGINKRWLSVHDENGVHVGSVLFSLTVQFEKMPNNGSREKQEKKRGRKRQTQRIKAVRVNVPTVKRKSSVGKRQNPNKGGEKRKVNVEPRFVQNKQKRRPPYQENVPGMPKRVVKKRVPNLDLDHDSEPESRQIPLQPQPQPIMQPIPRRKKKKSSRSRIKFRKKGPPPPSMVMQGSPYADSQPTRNNDGAYLDQIIHNAKDLFNEMTDFEENAKNEFSGADGDMIGSTSAKSVFRDPTVFVNHDVRLKPEEDFDLPDPFENITNASIDSIDDFENIQTPTRIQNDLDAEIDEVSDEQWVREKLEMIMPKGETGMTILGGQPQVSVIQAGAVGRGMERGQGKFTTIPEEVEKSNIKKELKDEIDQIRKEMEEMKKRKEILTQKRVKVKKKGKSPGRSIRRERREKTPRRRGDPKYLTKIVLFVTAGRIDPQAGLTYNLIENEREEMNNRGEFTLTCKVPVSLERSCSFTFPQIKNSATRMAPLHALHIFDAYSDSPNFLERLKKFSCALELRYRFAGSKKSGEGTKFLGLKTVPLLPFSQGFSQVENELSIFDALQPIAAHEGMIQVNNPLDYDRSVAVFDISLLIGKPEHVPKIETMYFNSLERHALERKGINYAEIPQDKNEIMMPLEPVVVKGKNIVEEEFVNVDVMRSVLKIEIIRAAGLKQAVVTVSKKKQLGLNLACKTGVNSFVQFEIFEEWNSGKLDDFSSVSMPSEEKPNVVYETDIDTRTFCPKWNYSREIEFLLDEHAYSRFEKDELLFHIFHRIPRSTQRHLAQRNSPSVVLLGVASVKLSPLLVCKGGITKWATIHDPFTGGSVGAIEIKLSFDGQTEKFLKIEENQNQFIENANEPMTIQKELNEYEEVLPQDKLEVCKLAVFIEEVSVPRQILLEHVSLYTLRKTPQPVFSCHYFVTYSLLGKNKPIETRLYSASSSVGKIVMHHTEDAVHPIGPVFFNYLKNETIEFKLYVCIDEIKTDEATERENGIYLGSCYISLSPLLFKKIESAGENLVWIGGDFTLINPNADDLSLGAMKMKVVCETVTESKYEKIKKVKNGFGWMDGIEDGDLEPFGEKQKIDIDEGIFRRKKVGKERERMRKKGGVRFSPSNSLDGMKDYRTSLRKIRREIEERMSMEFENGVGNEDVLIVPEDTNEVVIEDDLTQPLLKSIEKEMRKMDVGVDEDEEEEEKEPIPIVEEKKETIIMEESISKEIQTDFVDETLKEPSNRLTITVLSAFHLPEMSSEANVMKPSCCVSVFMKSSPSTNDLIEIGETPIVERSCNPYWNYQFKLPILQQVEKLFFVISHRWKKKKRRRKLADEDEEEGEYVENRKLIGKCEVDLGVLYWGMDVDGWYQLQSDFPNVSSNLRVSIVPDTYYVGKRDKFEVLPNVTYNEKQNEVDLQSTLFNDGASFEDPEIFHPKKAERDFPVLKNFIEEKQSDNNNNNGEVLKHLKRKLSQTLMDLEEQLVNISNSSVDSEDESLMANQREEVILHNNYDENDDDDEKIQFDDSREKIPFDDSLMIRSRVKEENVNKDEFEPTLEISEDLNGEIFSSQRDLRDIEIDDEELNFSVPPPHNESQFQDRINVIDGDNFEDEIINVDEK